MIFFIFQVGFLFHHELSDLAQWMSPMMSQVRKRLKQQTAAVNAVPQSTPRGPAMEDGTACHATVRTEQVQQQGTAAVGPKTTPASALSLANLLAAPQDISLTRVAESESLLTFFLPQLRKSTRPESTQIGAPADRVNRILVWLAWEGGLTAVYEAVQRNNQQQRSGDDQKIATPADSGGRKPRTPTANMAFMNIANDLVEEALVNAITEGCKVVKDKLTNALQMLNQSVEWTGRGDDVLEFCQVNE